jgi:hypothetical protein
VARAARGGHVGDYARAGRALSADLLELGISYRASGPAEQRVSCPRCDRGERDDALGVNIETGVYHCFRCGWSGKAAGGETRGARPYVRLDDPERAERTRQWLREVWKAAKPLGDRAAWPVRNYLKSRGLEVLIAALPGYTVRAHPALTYWDSAARREVGQFPAMLCILTGPDGKPRAVHATYLRHDGYAKAPVGSPKKILRVPTRGATIGGAVRLFDPRDGALGVCEGIENALSLVLLHKVPCWSSYCADNLAQVRLPALQRLHIGVDVDDSGTGERVARALADRAKREQPHLDVRLVVPPGEGPRDLNDQLRRTARKSRSGNDDEGSAA